MIYTMEFLKRVLAMLKLSNADAVDGTLDGAKVILIGAGIVPDKNTVLADLTESDFAGYARSTAITWATPFISSESGVYVMGGDLKQFNSTDTGDPEPQVYGYAIISGDVTPVLLAVKMLDEPEPITDGHSIAILPRVGFNSVGKVPSGDVPLT